MVFFYFCCFSSIPVESSCSEVLYQKKKKKVVVSNGKGVDAPKVGDADLTLRYLNRDSFPTLPFRQREIALQVLGYTFPPSI